MNTNRFSQSDSQRFVNIFITRKISHERVGRILAGVSVIFTVILALLIHPLFYIGLAGIGINLVQSGITNQCLIKDLLIKLGFPGEADFPSKNSADMVKPKEIQKDLNLSVI
ncbi:MAG: hypothetical protein COA79_04125 [Planctomycetota bacterium]|nr:MAG: hypothetical protein COA79_04125 [Planctomycetota bacterium]